MKNSCIYHNWQKVKNHEITYSQLIENKLLLCKQSIKNQDNIVLELMGESALQNAKSLDARKDIKDIFAGMTFLLKDNVNVKGSITTSGSLVCKDFVSPFNATIVNKINDHDAIILGKVNLDEFGHAGTGLCSAFGIVKNPIDNTRITGGSSSGSAAAIKLGLCDVAIGSDTGDSIRHPASFLGIVGYKPSYGLVSRYGVTPYASSLDHIGVLANSVIDVAIGIDVIKGQDKFDLTSIHVTDNYFYQDLKLHDKKFKFLVFDNVVSRANNAIQKQFNKFISDLKTKHEIVVESFDENLLKMLMPIYMTTSYLEGFTNWNNVNGITFGGKNISYSNYQDLAFKTRSQFGHEVKNRYLINSLVLNDNDFLCIYENTQKIRRIIVNKVNELLQQYDAIVIPSASSYAPSVQDTTTKQYKANECDDTLLLANFAGLPSITIPLTSNEHVDAIGINITSSKFSDAKLLEIAYNLEDFIKNKGYYNE